MSAEPALTALVHCVIDLRAAMEPRTGDEQMGKQQSPNDQRSNVKNPNNPAHAADAANRQSQTGATAPATQPTTESSTPQPTK